MLKVAMKARKRLVLAARLAFPLIIGTVLGVWQIKPPAADETSYAFQRMMSNIERLAQRPRVVGTANLEYVSAQIIAEIEDMGLVPVVQAVWYTRDEVIAAHRRLGLFGGVGRRFFALPDEILVVNIFVQLKSPDTDRGIMFVTHLDSWPGSPGAGDAMVAITAMLEAMRAHADNEALASSIYFLFTDGEEFGSIGALAFIEEHPDLKDRIDMIINLDAQGNSGGLILYETSQEAYAMLNVFRRAVPWPIGFSMGAAVYSQINTSTDFTFFNKYGWSGVNLAIIEGLRHYHRPTDTYENLNRSTAWHYLTTVLGLADYAANNSLEESLENSLQGHGRSSDAVFFMLLPGNMVLLSYLWANILCAFACLLAFAYFVYEYKTRWLRASFSSILTIFLFALSISSVLFLHAGSYLFWLPLLVFTITAFLKKWETVHRIAQTLSKVIVMLLWAPLLYAFFVLVPAVIILYVFILVLLTYTFVWKGYTHD